MSCALCLGNKELCKSHIIPEFIFSPLYDQDHRFIEVTDIAKGVVKKGQKGYWQKLLCAECETKINRYERHSRRIFIDPLPPHILKSKIIREHPRLDYNTFKLFCLSVLWRASVSSLPIFRHVRLGPHENKIRDLLLRDDAGDTLSYPVQVFALHFEGEHFRDFLIDPTHVRIEGRLCYRFVMMGFVFFVYVSNHSISDRQKKLALQCDSVVRTYDSELRSFTFLREVWNTVRETTKDK